MVVDVKVGEAGAVRLVKQFGRLRELDQDVGLRRAAPAYFSAFLGDRLIERRHPTSGLLQLRPERFEGGADRVSQARIAS
jgi:hypothetical protein